MAVAINSTSNPSARDLVQVVQVVLIVVIVAIDCAAIVVVVVVAVLVTVARTGTGEDLRQPQPRRQHSLGQTQTN